MSSGASGDDGTPPFYEEIQIQIDILAAEIADLDGTGADYVIQIKQRAIRHLRGFLTNSSADNLMQE